MYHLADNNSDFGLKFRKKHKLRLNLNCIEKRYWFCNASFGFMIIRERQWWHINSRFMTVYKFAFIYCHKPSFCWTSNLVQIDADNNNIVFYEFQLLLTLILYNNDLQTCKWLCLIDNNWGSMCVSDFSSDWYQLHSSNWTRMYKIVNINIFDFLTRYLQNIEKFRLNMYVWIRTRLFITDRSILVKIWNFWQSANSHNVRIFH